MAKKKKKSRLPRHTAGSASPENHSSRKHARRVAVQICLAAGILLAAIAAVYWTVSRIPTPFEQASALQEGVPVPPPRGGEITRADFAGSEVCADCHREKYDQWRNSTHGRAGGAPDEVPIIARFDGKPLKFADATVTPMRREGQYLFKIEPRGAPAMEIPVEAVVGGGHMVGGGTQTFFAKAPDGTMRFLPFDFSRHRGRWFVQLRANHHWVPVSDTIALADLANWPPHRVLGMVEGFSNCQNCHGSQITVDFDPRNKQYVTQYSTLRINCESCHGPARRHVELMQSPQAGELADIGLTPLATLDKDASLEVCFRCHATKDAIAPGYLDGKPLADYFSLMLPFLAREVLAADGRVVNFAYQENHLFSDCYINGSMTCVDCHAPHSLVYRDNFGRPLEGRFDNGQCTGCHAAMAEKPEIHSKHLPGSPGSLCVSCHMPYLQENGVGPHIPYARSDHTIAIPRPAFDAAIGVENACQKCHRDRSVEWLDAKTREWYGEIKPHNQLVRNYLRAQDVRDFQTAAALLLTPEISHPIAQVRNLFFFVKRFLSANLNRSDSVVVQKLQRLAGSRDVDLQAFALMALDFGYGENPEVARFLTDRVEAAGDREGALRRRWGIALDYLGSQYALKGDDLNAIRTYQKALRIKPGDPFIYVNLAMAYKNRGDRAAAAAALARAAELKPGDIDLYLELANLYRQMGRTGDAIRVLETARDYHPTDPRIQNLLRELPK